MLSIRVRDMPLHLNPTIWQSIGILFLNSFMWLTATSISSPGHSLNSFVLVEASLLAQEFCLNSASKTCQRQIRTRDSNLCFKGSYGSQEKLFLFTFFFQKCQIKDAIILFWFQEVSYSVDFEGKWQRGLMLVKSSEILKGFLLTTNVPYRINQCSKAAKMPATVIYSWTVDAIG